MSDNLIQDGFRGPATSNTGGSNGGASDKITEDLTNGGTALAQGEVVRISANNTVVRAQANSAANSRGVVGVTNAAIAGAASGPVLLAGRAATVLLDAGLVGVAAGQYVWVSAVTAGRGTNVEPNSNGVVYAVIKDASGYAGNQTVVADVLPSWHIPAFQDRVVIGEGSEAVAGSIAIGLFARANGTQSILIGGSGLIGNESTAVGRVVDANFPQIALFGWSAIAAGQEASAFGHEANADSFGCSFGRSSFSQNEGSAFGYDSSAEEQACAFGRGADASGIGSIAIGYNAVVATGNMCHIGSATALGEITDFNVVNNSAGVSNRTLRAQSVPPAGNNMTGLWVVTRSNGGTVALRNVTLTAADPGVLQVANP